MGNDLISRSALKKQFANECLHNCYYCKLAKWDKKGSCYNCGLIDNAPRASFIISPNYVTELQNLNKALIKQLEELDRGQGEWIEGENGNIKCDNCGAEIRYIYLANNKPDLPNFCCECGAIMNKDKEVKDNG